MALLLRCCRQPYSTACASDAPAVSLLWLHAQGPLPPAAMKPDGHSCLSKRCKTRKQSNMIDRNLPERRAAILEGSQQQISNLIRSMGCFGWACKAPAMSTGVLCLIRTGSAPCPMSALDNESRWVWLQTDLPCMCVNDVPIPQSMCAL